ncbi:hypothetical protein NE857_31495 [Nocardiopsis exhalans]|uniref:Uncharacterized protein n=1 Tax=Nocardiopsis exhalans TaxID=163604 RepID=A0ABY5D8R1_9ACTN|nr:hypothetical protein [Nocardiopsis exhalans]USY19704.1 hypothetical protein NE857_31495 [Nocardiopsis exhalans]
MSAMFAPPAEITWYHAPWLEAAAAGRLRYDTTQHPIHGVNNNTIWCIWHGLLDDGDTGPVITPLGQALLDTYRANRTPPAPALPLSAPKAESRPTPAVQAVLF